MSKEVVAEVIALIELGLIAPEDIVKCLRKANSEPETALAEQPAQKTCLVANESCKHGSWCSEVYCQEHCTFVEQPAQQYSATSDHRLMENAQGDLERIKLVQTGVGIGKPEQQEPVAWTPIDQPYPPGGELDILMGDGSILCEVLPQSDGDLWWGGASTGERFIDPKYASVTHWRIHAEHTFPPTLSLAQRTWQGLTDGERKLVRNSVGYSQFVTAGEYAEHVQKATEAKLDERFMEPPPDFIDALKYDVARRDSEFFTHCVDQPYDWSEWVCPDPKGYLMKCCDCGLVHEAEFGVVRYKSETEREDCDMVDDPNLQAVFRMRRSEQWSPADTAHRAGGLTMEQPAQQEPVARQYQGRDGVWKDFISEKHYKATLEDGSWPIRNLYTSPQSKPWVDLTQQDINIAFDDTQEGGGFDDFARAIEAKLREKNAQPSKPLTDEQIIEMYNEPRSDAEMLEFARAIEAAHGIKEQK